MFNVGQVGMSQRGIGAPQKARRNRTRYKRRLQLKARFFGNIQSQLYRQSGVTTDMMNDELAPWEFRITGMRNSSCFKELDDSRKRARERGIRANDM